MPETLRDSNDSDSGPKTPPLTRVVVTTGLSGAGRSSALGALEDAGYLTVHGPPLGLAEQVVAHLKPDAKAGIAISIDARSHGFSADAAMGLIQRLRADPTLDVSVVFLDCADTALFRRFDVTRRRHALALSADAAAGIARERAMLTVLEDYADTLLDTTSMSLTDLRREMSARYGAASANNKMAVAVMSFGFKHGVPAEADIVFDVRFLANPHWEEPLRHLTGLSDDVGDYVAADPGFDPFFEGFSKLIIDLLPRYEQEGKSYLCVAVGCTGGQHRSVYVARRLSERLAAAGRSTATRHRDMPRAS